MRPPLCRPLKHSMKRGPQQSSRNFVSESGRFRVQISLADSQGKIGYACYLPAALDNAIREQPCFYFCSASALVLIRKRLCIRKALSCATGRSSLVQNQTTFSASHVQAYWAHLGLVTYKKEVLSIRQLEAMQPRSRKELRMLLTDKQQGRGSYHVLSLAVDSKRKAKVGVIAIHSLRVACLTSKNRETASRHDTF